VALQEVILILSLSRCENRSILMRLRSPLISSLHALAQAATP